MLLYIVKSAIYVSISSCDKNQVSVEILIFPVKFRWSWTYWAVRSFIFAVDIFTFYLKNGYFWLNPFYIQIFYTWFG